MIDCVVLPGERGGWWHDYVCPAHGTELGHVGLETGTFPDAGAPCPYGCSIDNPKVRGAWTVLAHRECARLILDAARRGNAIQQQQAARLLEQYADMYRALPSQHSDAPSWMLRGRLFHQGLTEAIWGVEIAQAAWSLIDAGVEMHASVSQLLTDLAEAARAGRDALVAEGKFDSNYVAWLNAAGVCCTRDPEWLNGEHGMFNHLLIATFEDGWQWEASTYYHSFVLRAINAALTALPSVQIPEPIRERLTLMRQVLTRLQTDSGFLPALHDGPYQSDSYDAELAELQLTPEERGDGVTVFVDAGYAIVRSHGIHAVLDFGEHGGSHGHRDKLALYLYGPTSAWQPDPGQVPYGNQARRVYYMSTRAHPTFSVDGLEQAECSGTLADHDATSITVRCDDAYPGVSATRRITCTEDGLRDELNLSSDGSRNLTSQLRPAGALTVVMNQATTTAWAGTERLHGTHFCSVPAEFAVHPGAGTALDPQVAVSHVDWTAYGADSAEFRSDYTIRTHEMEHDAAS